MRGVENHISTTVSYPYVWTVCGNVDFLWSLKKKERKKQHCHRSSGSDMVSGVGWRGVGRWDEDGKRKRERERGKKRGGKKAQLMTSSYASVHLLMSFQGEAGRAGAKAEPGCERPGPSLPCCDPCLPAHKEPRLPATNEC